MTGKTTVRDGVGRYGYYSCPAQERGRQDYARSCDAPLFRVDEVDAGAWVWIRDLLTDPDAFARGLRKYQAEREKENQPIRARLTVVDDLLAENQAQLDRLLDLYLAGDFPKHVLTDRKSRLERTVSALEQERDALSARLEAGTLTDTQIVSLKDFAAKVAPGLEVAEADFATRRGVVEALDMQVVLAVEDGQKVVHARCVVGKGVYNLHPVESLL
jgi:hypothetical protein